MDSAGYGKTRGLVLAWAALAALALAALAAVAAMASRVAV